MKENLTVAELIELQKRAETRISVAVDKILQEFQQSTGICVTAVDIRTTRVDLVGQEARVVVTGSRLYLDLIVTGVGF